MIKTNHFVGVVALAMLTAACHTAGNQSGPAASATPRSGTVAATPRAQPLALSKDAVSQIQTALKSKGFYGGPVDGIAGPETRAALANYRQSQGEPRTATLDQKTLQSLVGTTTAANAQPQANASGSSAPPGKNASGSSSQPGKMDADQIRNQLQAQGYSDVNDVRPSGEQDFTAKAVKDGQTHTVQVDGRTGQVVSSQ